MQANDEKRISILMHELRSPINALLALIEQTRAEIVPNQKIDKALERMHGIVSYLLSLSNNYLEIHRSENSRLESCEDEFCLKNVFDGIVNLFSFQFGLKQITFTKNMADLNIIVFSDSLKIKQILINILSNAFKYTPFNGKVNLDVKVNYINKDNIELIIKIQDTGKGISKTNLEKIFTPYNCEDNKDVSKSVGLGLSIVKDYLKILNGSLKVDSNWGEGTLVEINIPFKVITRVYDFSKYRFLIIDDCNITMQIITYFLSSTNVMFDLASDGEEGLNTYLQSPDGYYDLILLDNKMIRLDGEEVVKRIKNCTSRSDSNKIKLIFMSANGLERDIKRCLETGVNAYLVKPLTKEKLLQSIVKALNI